MSVARIPVRAADGAQLHLHRVAESGIAGRPLLMIPGMFANHTFFLQRGRGLAHFLARQRPVYVLERRRTGTFDEIVQHDVRSACEAVAAEEAASGGRMVLAGHSAGAGAALCAALSQEDVRARLSGLALLSVPHPATGGVTRRAGLAFGIAFISALGRFPARRLRMGNVDEAGSIFVPWLLWHWRGHFGPHLRPGARLPPEVPLFSGSGSEDSLWAPPAGVRRLHEQVAGENSLDRCFIFPGFNHSDVVTGPLAQGQLWAALDQWLGDTD